MVCRSVNFEMRCTYFLIDDAECPAVCNSDANACGEDL